MWKHWKGGRWKNAELARNVCFVCRFLACKEWEKFDEMNISGKHIAPSPYARCTTLQIALCTILQNICIILYIAQHCKSLHIVDCTTLHSKSKYSSPSHCPRLQNIAKHCIAIASTLHIALCKTLQNITKYCKSSRIIHFSLHDRVCSVIKWRRCTLAVCFDNTPSRNW